MMKLDQADLRMVVFLERAEPQSGPIKLASKAEVSDIAKIISHYDRVASSSGIDLLVYWMLGVEMVNGR